LNRFADSRQFEAGKANDATRDDFRRGAVVLKELSQILGIFREPPLTTGPGQDQLVAGLVQIFLDLRAEARKTRNFALADQIRQRLGQLGITLEDRPGGTIWRLG
jgi:cysteinyl-tRNA synthetase